MRDSGDSPARSSLAEERRRTIEALTAHFTGDRITTEEFEARVDRVFRARTLREVRAIQLELPTLPPAGGAAIEGGRHPLGTPVAAPEEIRNRQVVAALLGGTERRGAWKPARHVLAFAAMGGVVLDFREARFGPGVTKVHAVATMGGIVIVVPPELNVESHGMAVLGGFDGLDQGNGPPRSGEPVLRVHGVAFMGGVEVQERLPGETERDMKRRLRAEKKARKRLERGR